VITCSLDHSLKVLNITTGETLATYKDSELFTCIDEWAQPVLSKRHNLLMVPSNKEGKLITFDRREQKTLGILPIPNGGE
jgi:hypothetical protein